MPHNLINMPYIAKWMSNSDSAQKITPKDIFTAKNIDSKKSYILGVVQQKLRIFSMPVTYVNSFFGNLAPI